MNLEQLKEEFITLGSNYRTKDVNRLNKKLIKEKQDVAFLKDICLNEQKFHRTYFQVSLGLLKTVEEQFKFIEDNFYLLNDWWHVDQLEQFIKIPNLDYAYSKAKEYVNHPHPFARRWGYVLFMPTLVKDERSFEMIVNLLKNDSEYYVIMAEAWLISYLAIYHPKKTYQFFEETNLDYSIIGRAIQKTCDSFRVTKEYKEKVKLIRNRYKK